MNFQDYLRIARQRWILILVTLLVAIGAGVLLTVTATPQYQSTARLFVSTQQGDDAATFQGGQFSQQRVKSYANLLTGEEMSRRVVEELGIGRTPRALAGQISATVQPDTVVLAISVTDPDPELAQELTQTLAEEFVDYVAEIETPDGQATAPVKASIVDRATVPGSPVSPDPIRNIGLAVVLGLLIGAGLAVLRDSMDNRIRELAHITDEIGDTPLLGNINFDKKATKSPLITGLPSHSPRVESFRVMRTNLQFVNAGSGGRTFVFTSALPGDGKTSTVTNLALSIAETGQKVLLLEADLRRPRAATYLNLENSVGVTTVLLGKVTVQEAIQPITGSADLLASGTIPPNPAELLQSAGMQRMLRELEQMYDVILIDAPPLLPVTDASLLASIADGAIIVIHHGVTTRDQLHAAAERLISVEANLLGTIVNMTPPPKRSGSYGYGYGYGYGYAPTGDETSPAVPDRSRSAQPDEPRSELFDGSKPFEPIVDPNSTPASPGRRIAPKGRGRRG